MKLRLGLIICIFSLVGLVTPIIAQQDDEDVRGAFLTTRPKPAPKSSKPVTTSKPKRRRPPVVPTPDPIVKPGTDSGSSAKTLNKPRIGLGLTLFMRDSNGLAVRTEPKHEFRKGDHVRFLIETNADGFLYIFNTTDGGAPVMIYPDAQLDEAGNYFQAHVPFEMPSSTGAEERFRWFTFDDKAGSEKLYFVFTREPLAAVPMEDDLISYCRDNQGKCPWHPADDTWTRIQKEAGEPVKIAKASGAGKQQSDAERQAVVRGIGLNRDDPEPSLIMLTASTTRDMLVAVVDLVHIATVAGN